MSNSYTQGQYIISNDMEKVLTNKWTVIPTQLYHIVISCKVSHAGVEQFV